MTAHYMYVLYCYDLLCKQHGCMLLTWETEILTSTCLTFSFGELVNIVFHIVHYQVRSSSVYSWSINTWKRNKPHILDYCVIRAFFYVWRLKFKAIFRNDGIALLPWTKHKTHRITSYIFIVTKMWSNIKTCIFESVRILKFSTQKSLSLEDLKSSSKRIF